MDRHLEKSLWLGVGLQALGLLISGLLWLAGGVAAVRIPIPFAAAGLLICLTAAWRERLSRQAGEEERDLAAVGAAEGESLFATDPDQDMPFSAVQQLHQFERLILPWMTPVLALICGGGAFWLATAARLTVPPPGPLAAGFLGGYAFVTFLLHRVLLAVSRRTDNEYVRSPAIWLGLTAYTACLTAIVVLADAWAGASLTAPALLIVAVFTGLLAVEAFVMTVMMFYRSPAQRKLLPASRLGALLCDPATWAHSVAATLDYQFGFRISETWIYQSARRLILPLLAAQLLLLYFSHSLVILQSHEAAVIEVLGRPAPRVLQAGIHWVLPPPWHRVRRFPMHRLQSVRAGFDMDSHDDPHRPHNHTAQLAAPQDAIHLWTEEHHDDEHDFLLAARDPDQEPGLLPSAPGGPVPVTLLSISLSVDYHVTDLIQYLSVHRDPVALLQQSAARFLTIEAVHADLFELLGPGQQALIDRITQRLRRQVDDLGLGIAIRQVHLHGIHPPVAVASAFEAVIGADELYEGSLQEGSAYRMRRLPAANAEAYAMQHAAIAARERRLITSEAESDLFLSRTRASAAAPEVYAIRAIMDVLESRLPHSTRHLIAAPADSEVIQIDLSERPYAALLDAAGRLDAPEP